MRRFALCFTLLLLAPLVSRAQDSGMRFVADTLMIQAEGSYEAEPDLATLTFNISAQEKELKLAYDKASASMQKIVDLAQKNGIAKGDVYSGALIVTPFYSGDRNKRARSFQVTGQITLKIKDFTKLGPIMDESVTDEITDFRSLTYSLSDEEAAKQHAVDDAMRRAAGRATAALTQRSQKVGALRFANVDVSTPSVITALVPSQLISVNEGFSFGAHKAAVQPPPPPATNPGKIAITATVQCAFQIQ